MAKNVFGQHLAHQVVSRALKSHVRRSSTPSKALVLSFHGYTGGGKNFVSKFIAESLYKKGLKSTFVHLFIATLHFPKDELADEYKLNLLDWIRGNVSQCEQSLFIFDEVDKMPPGVMDAVKPFVDHHDSIGGVNFRRSIFIFLSNTGGVEITHKSREAWDTGKKREDLRLIDFEQMINRGAFNEAGGLHHSVVIGTSLVDHFIPFLPMERSHVRKCVLAEAGNRYISEKVTVTFTLCSLLQVSCPLCTGDHPHLGRDDLLAAGHRPLLDDGVQEGGSEGGPSPRGAVRRPVIDASRRARQAGCDDECGQDDAAPTRAVYLLHIQIQYIYITSHVLHNNTTEIAFSAFTISSTYKKRHSL